MDYLVLYEKKICNNNETQLSLWHDTDTVELCLMVEQTCLLSSESQDALLTVDTDDLETMFSKPYTSLWKFLLLN